MLVRERGESDGKNVLKICQNEEIVAERFMMVITVEEEKIRENDKILKRKIHQFYLDDIYSNIYIYYLRGSSHQFWTENRLNNSSLGKYDFFPSPSK